jgi:hypothetical protein
MIRIARVGPVSMISTLSFVFSHGIAQKTKTRKQSHDNGFVLLRRQDMQEIRKTFESETESLIIPQVCSSVSNLSAF